MSEELLTDPGRFDGHVSLNWDEKKTRFRWTSGWTPNTEMELEEEVAEGAGVTGGY